MKPILMLTLLLAVPGTVLNGLTIVVSGVSIFAPDQQTQLPSESHYSIGYFAEEFTDFAGLYGRSWTDVTQTDFVEVFQPVSSNPGSITGSGAATGIEGRQLFLWIFAESDFSGLVGQSAFGLYTGESNWLAGGDGIIPFELNRLSVDTVTTAIYGADLGSGIALAAVPEPAQMVLYTGLLICGWVQWIRRRTRLKP